MSAEQLQISFDRPRNDRQSQSAAILRHLESGQTINPLQALRLYGSFRLGARIKDLRSLGHNIETEMVEQNGKRFASYRLKVNEPARDAETAT